MRSFVALLMLFSVSLACGEDWIPPENPDPQTILNEARNDRSAGRFGDALAKHVWFHENALSITPAMYGVRLSFALSDWHRLAKLHEPAMDKLEETREAARERVLSEENPHPPFHDFVAINRELGEESRSVEFFLLLDDQHPLIAKQVIDLARPALISQKNYTMYAKYVDVDQDLERILRLYRLHKKLVNDGRQQARLMDFANKKLTNDAATLVAILVIEERLEDALKVLNTAKKERDDPEFHEALEKAIQGEMPKPWP